MKVCTDSCIFGSYVAQSLKSDGFENQNLRILDVGAGTGLLTLMAAQKVDFGKFTAIEPDLNSFEECKMNFEKSNWTSRLEILNLSLQDFLASKPTTYDIIFCNPPFFLNHLASPLESRNKALHISKSEWENWFMMLEKLLHTEGQLWLLLPGSSSGFTQALAGKLGLHVGTKVELHQKPKDNWRNILSFSRKAQKEMVQIETSVYDENKGYSHPVIDWLSDYYLKL